MINELRIEGFRGFDRYCVTNLGRVNLLVGTNNCGKTSILEALQIFGSQGDPLSLLQAAFRRGERLEPATSRRAYTEAEVCHLFHGHEIEVGSEFRIVANKGVAVDTLLVDVVEGIIDETRQQRLFDDESGSATDLDFGKEQNWHLKLEWSGTPTRRVRLPLSGRGGVSSEGVLRYTRPRSITMSRGNYIPTAGLTVPDVIGMFEDIVLTSEEQLVTEALQVIHPKLERLATVGSDRARGHLGERGGIVIKCVDSSQRIPIGSMGDGMWRMLGLALALVSAENGLLLVDEIDTGLHYSVLEQMWKLVRGASSRLNVQVFATTHSRDAYESLAAISRDTVSEQSDEVTIQRIERDRTESVAFSEQEIVAAAERGVEVR